MAQGLRRNGWACLGILVTGWLTGCASSGKKLDLPPSGLPLPSSLPAPDLNNRHGAPPQTSSTPAPAPSAPASAPASLTPVSTRTTSPTTSIRPPSYQRPSPSNDGFIEQRSLATIQTNTMPTTAGTQYAVQPAAPVRQPIATTSPATVIVPARTTSPIATPTPPAAVVVPQSPPSLASTDRWKEPSTPPAAGLTNLTPPERPVAVPVGPPQTGWIQDVPALPAKTTTTATTTSNAIQLPAGPIAVVTP
ncbi:MAG: hypothetical protein LC104_14105 [Bacteroidales bacterium]|nr:hypothetical protein [Bacteroidales bacterium]